MLTPQVFSKCFQEKIGTDTRGTPHRYRRLMITMTMLNEHTYFLDFCELKEIE